MNSPMNDEELRCDDGSEHMIGRNAVDAGHGARPSGPQICLKCRKTLKVIVSSRDQQIDLSNSERFDYNRLKALEVKSIDDYKKLKADEPNSPERIAAWIHQLSPWNLERGVEALRERDQQIALEARLDEIKLMAEYVNNSPFAYPELAGGFANNYMNNRIAILKQAQKDIS